MRMYIFAGVIFGLVGIGFIVSSFVTFNEIREFNQNSEKSIGTIINIETRTESLSNPGSRGTSYTDYLIIEFSDKAGSKHITEALVYPGQEFQIGEELRLSYSPDDPTNTVLESFWDQYGWLIISLVFGIGFSLGGYFSVWEGIKDKIIEKRAFNYREMTEATITNVEEHQFNEKSKPIYIIVAEGVHPRTNEKMTFRSKRLKEDHTSSVGKSVDIKFHPTKEKWYWMDIDSIVRTN